MLIRFRGHLLSEGQNKDLPRHRDTYPSDFKTNLVVLALGGRSREELADSIEPAGQTIRNGVRQTQLDVGDRKDGLTSNGR